MPETTIVSASAGCIVTSTLSAAGTLADWKPAWVTRNVPLFCADSMSNAPFASVTARADSIVTTAPGTGTPFGSFTIPWMLRKKRTAKNAFMEILSKKFFQRALMRIERFLYLPFPTPVSTGSGSKGLISGRYGHPQASCCEGDRSMRGGHEDEIECRTQNAE